jgi:dolichol kinase
MTTPLVRLVNETAGMQPWRRVFHTANGVLLVLVLGTFPIPRSAVLLALGGLFLALLLLDAWRLARPGVNLLFFRLFAPLVSPREEMKIASSTWYALGIFLTILLFSQRIALPAILTLALADPAAVFSGRTWGRRKLGKGTWVGSFAFALVASAALLLFFPWPVALGAALAATAVEAAPLPLDDNLTIPLATAGVLFLLL